MDTNKKYRFLFASALFTGNESFFLNLRDALGRIDEVDSTWMPLELSPPERFARVPPLSLNYSLKNAAVALSRIRALERSGKSFDAAFINHVTPAYFLAEFMGRVPTVLSLDVTPRLLDSYSEWYQSGSPLTRGGILERLKRAQTRKVYERSAALLPWSTLVKESLVQEYGIEEKRIAVIPPGIDLNLWNSPHRHNGVPPGEHPLNILFVGGHFIRKGGDLLLRVARRPEFQGCEFHLVTRTFEGVKPGNVFIHPGISPNSEDLRELYRKADIFAFPTRADFSPLAVCEALAMGLPVITTAVGALGEQIEDGETGFFIPLEDETVFADRLLRLTMNHELRTRMARNARDSAERRFNLETNARAIVDILQRVSKRRAAHAPQVLSGGVPR